MTASVKMAGCLLNGERKVIRKFIYLILVTMLAGLAMAQDVSVRSDHPDEYTVVKGDTLWDIAARFLDHPWQWPAIWYANQQIHNPHLIYPGDVLSLKYVDGKPQMVVNEGKPTVRLSPEIHRTESEPVTAIPHAVIAGFIRNMRVVSATEFKAMPYVLTNNEDRQFAAKDDHTYARGVKGAVGDRFAIVRLGNVYVREKGEIRRKVEPGYGQHAPNDIEFHPGFWENAANFSGKRGEVIGYELYEVGQGTLEKTGDPAILRVRTGLDAIRKGDRIVPLDTKGYPNEYMPHALDNIPADLRVLAIQAGHLIAGHHKVVAINAGSRQGMEPGLVFSAFRQGKRIRDDIKYPSGSLADASTWNGDKVNLPDEYEGHIMVFRVFDQISYALIMGGPRPLHEQDILKHPDETL